MKKEVLDKVNTAFDSALKKFLNDPDIIYSTENERLKLKYADQKKRKSWKKNKNCIYDGCINKSITKSHTIQKTSSIKLISENEHVLTPKFNDQNGKLELTLQGIGDASTFPGFCKAHENMFEEFEKRKDLINESDFALQLYRTICREIVIAEHSHNKLTSALQRYIKHRDKKIEEIFNTELGIDFVTEHNIQSNGFELKGADYKQKQGEEEIASIIVYLQSLQDLKRAITNDINKKKFQKIECVTIGIDVFIPVCIAGRGNFQIKPKSKIKNIEVIFNILPHNNKTYLVICSLKKYTKELRMYIDQFKNPLQVLSFIERLMIHGSDHWFIKPSVWNKIDDERKNQIVMDIHDSSKNIGHDYAYSIFDDLRKANIELMEDSYDQLDEKLKELLEIERKKITFA
jgi:hypothetical protein